LIQAEKEIYQAWEAAHILRFPVNGPSHNEGNDAPHKYKHGVVLLKLSIMRDDVLCGGGDPTGTSGMLIAAASGRSFYLLAHHRPR